MFKRKNAAAAPDVLLEQVRAAQQAHAAEVTAANQRLVDSHTSIYSDVKNRQETISEQISLLNAEHEGLAKVADAANPVNVTRAGQ